MKNTWNIWIVTTFINLLNRKEITKEKGKYLKMCKNVKSVKITWLTRL